MHLRGAGGLPGLWLPEQGVQVPAWLLQQRPRASPRTASVRWNNRARQRRKTALRLTTLPAAVPPPPPLFLPKGDGKLIIISIVHLRTGTIRCGDEGKRPGAYSFILISFVWKYKSMVAPAWRWWWRRLQISPQIRLFLWGGNPRHAFTNMMWFWSLIFLNEYVVVNVLHR